MLKHVKQETTMVHKVTPRAGSVLVVEDDPLSLAILRTRLKEMGMGDIQEAGNGHEAVQLLETMAVAPDFLICDIFMPAMDGIEFIGELARRRYQGGLILVSGGNHDMLEVAAEIASLNQLRLLGSFGKPVPVQLLRQAMGMEAD
jgi:CheY-like chemotaxis protein